MISGVLALRSLRAPVNVSIHNLLSQLMQFGYFAREAALGDGLEQEGDAIDADGSRHARTFV